MVLSDIGLPLVPGPAERGEDVAPGALARDGGDEIGPLVEWQAAGPRKARRDLLRRDAHTVGHYGLELAEPSDGCTVTVSRSTLRSPSTNTTCSTAVATTRLRAQFTMLNRRHHCRRVFCARCMANSVQRTPGDAAREVSERIRVCNYCFKRWLEEESAARTNVAQPWSPSSSAGSIRSDRSCSTGRSSGATNGQMSSYANVSGIGFASLPVDGSPCGAGWGSGPCVLRGQSVGSIQLLLE